MKPKQESEFFIFPTLLHVNQANTPLRFHLSTYTTPHTHHIISFTTYKYPIYYIENLAPDPVSAWGAYPCGPRPSKDSLRLPVST